MYNYRYKKYLKLHICRHRIVNSYHAIYLSIFLSIYLSIYLLIYLSIYLCIYPSICSFIYVSMSLCIIVSMYLCIFLSMYVCMYVCMCADSCSTASAADISGYHVWCPSIRAHSLMQQSWSRDVCAGSGCSCLSYYQQ